MLKKPFAALSFFLAISLGAGSLLAAPVKTLGFADMSCQAWLQSKEDADQRKIYLAWIRGVLTGHNYARQTQQIPEISNGTVEVAVDRYCTEKPKSNFADAAFRLSDKLSGRNEAITK